MISLAPTVRYMLCKKYPIAGLELTPNQPDASNLRQPYVYKYAFPSYTNRPSSLQYVCMCALVAALPRVIKFGGDNGPLAPHLDDSMTFIESGVEDGGVLIHCTHGTGRSAAMAIAAAMKASGKGTPAGIGGFPEAFRLVKSRRPGTDPPMPFQEELGEWEKSHSG